MNINQYRQFTTATRKEMANQIENSIHFVLGVASEVLDELAIAIANNDSVNIQEEIGDANWFLSEYANNWNLITPDFYELRAEEYYYLEDITTNIGKLTDLDKGVWIYGKEVSIETRQNLLNSIWIGLEYLALGMDFNSNEIRRKNIAKLKVRFGDKFDAYLAKNRDLQSELEALTS